MIVFSGVSKSFGKKQALSHIDLRIEPGEFVCLTGPSGAGKSTILHLLIRLEHPTSGSIEVDGADLARLPSPVLQLYRSRTGILFQDYRLLADRTVFENVALSLEATPASDASIDRAVHGVLKRLDLSGKADAYPHELSGGEKTRVGLARALVHKPSILLVDEPTGNIDPAESQEILGLLREVNKEGATVMLATHDKLVVDALGVRVIRLEDGKIVRDSTGGYSEPATVHRSSVASVEESPKAEHAPKSQSGGHVKPVGVQ